MDTLGTGHFVEGLSSIWRLKCTRMIEKGPQLMSFIESFFFYSFRVFITGGSTVFTLC